MQCKQELGNIHKNDCSSTSLGTKYNVIHKCTSINVYCRYHLYVTDENVSRDVKVHKFYLCMGLFLKISEVMVLGR